MPNRVVRQNGVIHLLVDDTWYEYDEHAAPVGSGAMGVVYLGRQSGTNARVAIKMVRVQYANIPSIRQRARQEASLKFMHRNLIEMLGYCEWQKGSGPIWIISRYVQGITIDNYLANLTKTQQGYKRVCQVMIPVFDALHYLHTGSNQILHLDIKPSNIMVENGNNVRLMDLGIASSEAVTAIGGMLGTPNYAAPEQFDVNYGTVGVQTDIYQLAVTLYELITGTNPFDAPSIEEVKERHRTLMLPPHRNMPAEVLAVLQRGAHPNPSNRYQSVAAFRAALCQSLVQKPRTTFPMKKIAIIVVSIIFIAILALSVWYQFIIY